MLCCAVLCDLTVCPPPHTQVKLWELASRSLVQTVTEHNDQVWGVAFSADGKRLASVGDDKQLVVYSVA